MRRHVAVGGNEMGKADSLTRMDWTIAATVALGEAGVDGVRVEALARQLKTSKGSFYWHFRDRADLLDALLTLWEDEGTLQVIAAAAHLATPAERLNAVLEEAVEFDVHGVAVSAVEGAIRAWAGQDEAAAVRVRAIDARRVEYLRDELLLAGHGPEVAQRRAEGLYLALLGYYAAHRYGSPSANGDALAMLLRLAVDIR